MSVLTVIKQGPQQLLILLVKAYRLLLSPWLGSSCRFAPTCSAYTLQALQDHGAVIGAYLGGYRIVRCGPWCVGGHDAVPLAEDLRKTQPFKLFSVLLFTTAGHDGAISSSNTKCSL